MKKEGVCGTDAATQRPHIVGGHGCAAYLSTGEPHDAPLQQLKSLNKQQEH